ARHAHTASRPHPFRTAQAAAKSPNAYNSTTPPRPLPCPAGATPAKCANGANLAFVHPNPHERKSYISSPLIVDRLTEKCAAKYQYDQSLRSFVHHWILHLFAARCGISHPALPARRRLGYSVDSPSHGGCDFDGDNAPEVSHLDTQAVGRRRTFRRLLGTYEWIFLQRHRSYPAGHCGDH